MKPLMKETLEQTIPEEIANAVTHGLGVLLSIAALIAMLFRALNSHQTIAIVSAVVFGTSLILLYFSSTLYHAIQHFKAKQILQIIDHMMIYLLIAGTYTPFTLVALGGAWGWSLFGVVWGLALMGMVFKLFFTGKLESLSIGIYIGMGWLAIIAIKPFLHAIPFAGLMWVVAGGVFYTSGIIFYASDRVRYAHTVWHLFVLLGSLCHVAAFLFYVLPPKAL
jgi:hemolysin III